MVATAPLLDMSLWMNRLQAGHASIRDRVDALEEGSLETYRRLAIVEHKVDGLIQFTTEWRQEDRKRFDAIDRKLADHDKQFMVIDQRFDSIDRRFEAVDQRFDSIDRRFEAVDQRFEAVDQRFEAVENRLDSMDEKIQERFSELKDLLVDALQRKN